MIHNYINFESITVKTERPLANRPVIHLENRSGGCTAGNTLTLHNNATVKRAVIGTTQPDCGVNCEKNTSSPR